MAVTNDFDAEGAIHDSNPAAGGARTSPEASPIPDGGQHVAGQQERTSSRILLAGTPGTAEQSTRSGSCPRGGKSPAPIPPRTTEHPEGGGQGAVPPLSGAALPDSFKLYVGDAIDRAMTESQSVLDEVLRLRLLCQTLATILDGYSAATRVAAVALDNEVTL